MKLLLYIENGIRYNRIGDCTAAVVGFGIDMDVAIINIPAQTQNGYNVIGIAAGAFKKNQTIEEVNLPDTITLIGEKAFYKCTNLKSISVQKTSTCEEQDFPIGVGRNAFAGCINLYSMISCKPMRLIDPLAFNNCVLLTKLDVHFCGNLPEKSFCNCLSLSEFHFYHKEMNIGENCFENCPNLFSFWIYEDLALDEIFLQTFKNAEFKCHQNSKYCNLAYHGYNVKKIIK